MSVTYRSVLEGDPSELTPEAVTRIMNEWCTTKKGWQVKFPAEGETITGEHGQELTTTTWHSPDVFAHRWTAREHWSVPKWFENLTNSLWERYERNIGRLRESVVTY